MKVSRASIRVHDPETTTRPRRRSCYRCHRAFSTTSTQARVYCPTCCRRHGFPLPEAHSA